MALLLFVAFTLQLAHETGMSIAASKWDTFRDTVVIGGIIKSQVCVCGGGGVCSYYRILLGHRLARFCVRACVSTRGCVCVCASE